MSGKTTCKEVCSSCKCIVTEKPICGKKEKESACGKKEKECVATIVGVLSLPESFCSQKDQCADSCDPCKQQSSDSSCCEDPCAKKDECVEVFRDLGECLQKAIIKTSKSC